MADQNELLWPPEHPDEALFEQMESLQEEYNALMRQHGTFKCRKRGRERLDKTFEGCPKCAHRTGDQFAAWKIELELDFLGFGGEPVAVPDLLIGEEE